MLFSFLTFFTFIMRLIKTSFYKLFRYINGQRLFVRSSPRNISTVETPVGERESHTITVETPAGEQESISTIINIIQEEMDFNEYTSNDSPSPPSYAESMRAENTPPKYDEACCRNILELSDERIAIYRALVEAGMLESPFEEF